MFFFFSHFILDCSNYDLTLGNRALYNLKITKADNRRSLDPYAALESSPDGPLVISLEENSFAKIVITAVDSEVVLDVRKVCVDVENGKKTIVKFKDSEGNIIGKSTVSL